MDRKERYSRQESIVNGDLLSKMIVTVIGTGAIGRNLSIQLVSIGIQNLQLVDFDTIEESNVASQGFLESEIGNLKVNAVREACNKINKEAKISSFPTRFKRSLNVGDVVFCCVDKMAARSFIFETVKEKVDLFIDSRMAAETLQVYTVYDEESEKTYSKSLFTDEEAYQGTCTAKSTIYCANIAAGLMTSQFTKHLRDFPLDKQINFDIFSNELNVS